jgi:parvulin-like peptidyl-prolyl isomerase
MRGAQLWFIRIAGLAIFFAVVVFSLSCTRSISSQKNSTEAALPPAVATVNNQTIPTKLYQMYLINGREALGLDEKTEAGRARLDQLREGIVSELIDRVLVAQEAQRRGLSIPPDKLAAAEQRGINQFGGQAKYDEYLAEHHLSRDEYREVAKWEVYGEMMRGELSKDISVSDAEVKEYYEAHKGDARFQLPERVTASHVLVAARPNLIAQQLKQEKNLNGEALAAAVRVEMDQRRKRAEALRRQAESGTDFASLARQSSDDPGTRDRGGDLGTFTRDTHPKSFDDAVFAMKPGQVSAVVATDYGFHVIKLLSREPARGQTLAEATPEIRNALLGKRQAEKLTDWLKEARRKASIHINEAFRFGALKTEFAQS